MAHERTCIVCRKKYEYCHVCPKHKDLETWHYQFDTEECKSLYSILDQYHSKKISALEADNMIKDLNLTQVSLDDIHPVLQKDVSSMREELSAIQVVDETEDESTILPMNLPEIDSDGITDELPRQRRRRRKTN